jgi:hypothetical protein
MTEKRYELYTRELKRKIYVSSHPPFFSGKWGVGVEMYDLSLSLKRHSCN